MTQLHANHQVTRAVADQKQAAMQHAIRVKWTLAASLVAGTVVGFGAWFTSQPMDRDEVHAGLVLALAAATFFVGCLLGRLLFPRPAARCPRCGCDWNVESENDVHAWLAWRCCPRCGLSMNEDEDIGKRHDDDHCQRGLCYEAPVAEQEPDPDVDETGWSPLRVDVGGPSLRLSDVGLDARSLAIGATADGQWTIKRVGFFRPRVTIRLPDHDMDLATLQYHRLGASVLQLRDGTTYHWKATKRRRSERGFYTADGELVVGCVRRTKWLHIEGDVFIGAGQEKCCDLSLLILLGWYRLVLEHDDDAATAAAVAAVCCAAT